MVTKSVNTSEVELLYVRRSVSDSRRVLECRIKYGYKLCRELVNIAGDDLVGEENSLLLKLYKFDLKTARAVRSAMKKWLKKNPTGEFVAPISSPVTELDHFFRI